MYNTKLICTYSYYDPYLRNIYHLDDKYDLEDVQDFEDLAEIIYRTELLKALGFTLEEIENDEIYFNNEKIIHLYNKLNECENFKDCVIKIKDKHGYEDLETAFMTVFSYDYFFLLHRCICDLLNNGKIEEEHMNYLKNAIDK